jgi:hypothetical protein
VCCVWHVGNDKFFLGGGVCGVDGGGTSVRFGMTGWLYAFNDSNHWMDVHKILYRGILIR